MKSRFIRSFQKKLASLLTAALLSTALVPAAAGAAVPEETALPQSSITEAVTEAGTAPLEQLEQKALAAAAPLSWNNLTKLHRSFISNSSIINTETQLSADERYLAFSNYIGNNGARNGISLYDRLTGRTEELTMPDDQGAVVHFDMTPDARYFVFSYSEKYLNGKVRVYLYDRTATGNPLTVINDKTGPDVDRFTEGEYVSISDDGRYVVFDTEGQVVQEDLDNNWDVYLYDRDGAGSIQRISVPYQVHEHNQYDSQQASISGDGSKITFVSEAQLTEATDYTGTKSVYLYDRNAAEGQKLKRLAQGQQPSISADGGFLAFSTNRFDLGPLDENQKNDIYVYNTTAQTYALVSKNPNGTQHDGGSRNPAISRNGSHVAYELEINSAGNPGQTTTIYVADRSGFTSSKVNVENGVKPLLSPSSMPYVSDNGKTVTFYSLYIESIGGANFELLDHFIASQGTAPVWAAGSTLQASGIGDDRVTLTWPDATDSEGVEGYQLYANDEFVAYIPSSAANTYTVTGLDRQENPYKFQVDAVDSQYAQSYTGPTYLLEMLDDGEGPPPDGEFPLFITWQTNDRNYNSGTLNQGAKIRINAGGAPKSEAKAEWTYKEWEGDQEVTKTASLTLTENTTVPGFYTGTFDLTPATIELSSMKLIMKTGTQVVEETSDLEAIQVGGNLQVSFTGAAISEIQGAALYVEGPSYGFEFVGENGIETITGLIPDDNYELTLRTADHMYDIGKVEGVQVQSGKTSSVTIPVTVPARVRVQVLNEAGNPVGNVPVTLTDSKQNLLGTFDTREDGQTDWKEGLIRDEVVTASLDLAEFYDILPENANLSIKLDGGDNVLTVNLISPDRGEVEVTVKNPSNEPVSNTYVTATQIYKGKPVVTQGRTSLDGKVQFELFAGIDVELEGAESSFDYRSEKLSVGVPDNEPGKPTQVNLPVKQPATNVINLRVFKKALDTEWEGPLNMENESFHSLIRTKHGWVSTYFSNAVRLGGSPGSEVEVCVSGVIYAYVNSCKTVTMDENSNATAEVRLEETGARVQGNVPVSRNVWYSAELYEVRQDGIKLFVGNVWDNNFQSVPFNVNVPRGGTYQMNITKTNRDPSYHYTYEYASVEFSVVENQVKNIGNVAFSASSYFTNKSGNRFTAQPSKAVPGSTITMRASYRNSNEETAANAVLLLDIPEGMTLDSLEGVTGAEGVKDKGQYLEVPLGDLAKDASGRVIYKLKVSETFNKASLSAAARIEAVVAGKPVKETIGTVILDTQRVTLDAPEIVSDAGRLAVVSGYAPVGSTVGIYDSNVRIGAAVANQSGLWKTQITLTDLGSPSMHALWAETTMQSVDLKSAKSYVQYDHSGPQLLEMAFSQAPAGRWISVKMDKETPNYSYTVVPGNPFQFDFKFSNPDQVENVRVYMDGQEGDPILAARQGALFRATVPTKHDALGGIYLDYDVKKTPKTYDGKLPSLDQIRAQMPLKMRDFEIVSKNNFAWGADGTYTGDAVLKFPQLGNITMSFKMTVDPDSAYKPTEEEQELAERSGVPAILKSYDTVETDESLSITTRGYIPADLLNQELGVKTEGRVSALAKEGDWGHTAEYFMEIKADVDEVGDQISEVKDQYEGYMEYAEKINKIMYNVEASGLDCLEEMPNTAKQAGKALAYTILGEIAKTGMSAATAAMSLTGPAGAIAGGVTGIVEDKIDNFVDSQIDAIGSGYNECNDPDKKKKKGRKIGDPKWIYDPSGYVYEAVKSNPLKDVTATVQYKNAQGVWTKWEAEEYDQVNPQLTDAAGKYGWDVPVGMWRVVWTKEIKDGAGKTIELYEPTTSAEMAVPPPRTEVNYGLTSRKPPEIESVTGAAAQGGSFIDITFTKYVKVVQAIPADAVVVTNGTNAVLEGTLEFVKQEESAADKTVMLSKTIRFKPKNDLAADGAYQVKLNRSSFISYANTMMQEQDTGPKPVAMKVLDTTGPEVAAVKVENGGRIIRLTFNEPIQQAADAAKFQITGPANTVSSNTVISAVAVSQNDAADPNELLLTLNDPIIGQQSLKLSAGAVRDKEGNAIAEGTQSLQPQENTNLSGLVVGTGVLTPVFQTSVTEYSVQLPAGTKEFAVTATAADAAASLKIGTELAVSGKAKIVSIPEDGVIPVTVELGGGAASKTYTIQVTYAASQGPIQGPVTVETPAAKDPMNLGETAKIEKKPSANGGNALLVSISQDAVAEALKDNKNSKELYVEVKDQVDEVILEFPAVALQQLKEAEAALLVKTDMMNVRLEAASINTGNLPEGATIRVVVAKAEKKHSDAAALALKQQSGALKLLTDAVVVRAEAAHGSVVTPLAVSNESPLEGQFLGMAGAANEVYRYDADADVWQHVPSKPSADGLSLLFNLEGTGVYAAMSFTNPFRDTVGHWAQHDIDWMARRLLVNGVSPAEFRPEGSVTRAEFAAMLVRVLGLQLTETPAAAAFTDVRQGEWYYEEVTAAASAGLVNGLDSGRFAPQETITREQMAVMIGRAFQYAGLSGSAGTDTGVLQSFEDAGRIQSWAKADVALAVKEGLLQGLTEDSFGPSGITTRAQAAIVLERLLKKRD